MNLMIKFYKCFWLMSGIGNNLMTSNSLIEKKNKIFFTMLMAISNFSAVSHDHLPEPSVQESIRNNQSNSNM